MYSLSFCLCYFYTLFLYFQQAWCGIYEITHLATFEIEIPAYSSGERPYRGSFTIGLFGNTVPKTVENFIQLTNGFMDNGVFYTYKNTQIHRVVKDQVVQMGDVAHMNGWGGNSIYGQYFDDENFELSHQGPGWVGMANTGPNTNASQFYITLTASRWMDGKNVLFGKIIRGFDVVEMLGDLQLLYGHSNPVIKVSIVNSYAEKLDNSYFLKGKQLKSSESIIIM